MRFVFPNPPEKPLVCNGNVATPKQAMPEQFPLYFNSQPYIQPKIANIQQWLISTCNAIIIFATLGQQYRIHYIFSVSSAGSFTSGNISLSLHPFASSTKTKSFEFPFASNNDNCAFLPSNKNS